MFKNSLNSKDKSLFWGAAILVLGPEVVWAPTSGFYYWLIRGDEAAKNFSLLGQSISPDLLSGILGIQTIGLLALSLLFFAKRKKIYNKLFCSVVAVLFFVLALAEFFFWVISKQAPHIGF